MEYCIRFFSGTLQDIKPRFSGQAEDVMAFLNEETVEFFVNDFRERQKMDGELFKVDFGEIAVGCDPKISGGQLFFVDYLTGKRRCCPCDRIVSIGCYDPDCPRASETPF